MTIKDIALALFRDLAQAWQADGMRAASKEIKFEESAEGYGVDVDDVEAALRHLHQRGYIHWPPGGVRPPSTKLTPLGEDVCRGRSVLQL